ncbi:MAG: pilus assembly protein PilP [Polyangiaceae bacterium]|nr:pilus assembly protein PilP [Polyangiaceae bacterium]
MKKAPNTREVARRLAFAVAALVLPVFVVGGCEDDPPPPPPRPVGSAVAPAGAPGAPNQPAVAGAAPGPAGSGRAGAAASASANPLADLPERVFTEADFAETDKNRDPFRGFANVFAQQARAKKDDQRVVVVPRYALDELKLSGVITRAEARALFIDPNNVGWVVRTGDYVGKPEIVRAGGAAGIDIAIHWRVDRIREGDVVFVREDPAHPEIAPVTRVIPLFPADESGKPGR